MSVKKIDLILLPLITVLFVIRSAIPYTIYPFIFILVLYSIFFISKKYSSFKYFDEYIKQFWIFFLIGGFYFIGIINTDGSISLQLIKEVPNAIVVYAIGYYWYVHMRENSKNTNIQCVLLWQFIVFSLIASLSGLVKYFYSVWGGNFFFLEYSKWNHTTSLVDDNNYYSLMILIGIVIGVSLLLSKIKSLRTIFLQFVLLISSMSVLLSGSRRGMIIISLMYFIWFLFFILSIYKRKFHVGNILRKTWIAVIFPIFSFIIMLIFLIFTSASIKQKVLSNLKIDYTVVRWGINNMISEYYSILVPSSKLFDLEHFMWEVPDVSSIDQQDIFYLESNRIVAPEFIIFPIINNYSIPFAKGTSGILVNKKTSNSVWLNSNTNQNLAYSSIKLSKFPIDSLKTYNVSSYCFVSETNNLDFVEIRKYGRGKHKGRVRDVYNLNEKGSWQKIEFSFTATHNDYIQISMFTGLNDATDFSKLNGYVIYAKPYIVEINKDSIDIDSLSNSKFVKPNFQSLRTQEKLSFIYKVRAYLDRIFFKAQYKKCNLLFKDGNFLDAAIEYRKLLSVFPNDKSLQTKFFSAIDTSEFASQSIEMWNNRDSLYISNIYDMHGIDSTLKPTNLDNTAPRKLGELLSQNYIYNDSIIPESVNKTETFTKSMNQLYGGRIERWKYAWEIFIQESSISQKVFGSGFDYQQKFGKRFLGSPELPDYPHNPIISAFLYSGILGGLLYLYFLGQSIYRYWKLRKELALFGMLYILAFAFTFFSGNSHFSVPAFTLLSLLPFAFPIKKEGKNKSDTKIEEA